MENQRRMCRTGLALRPSVEYSRHMESERAILAFAALAQSTRLDVFRLLIEHEPHGLPAGEVARRLAVPHKPTFPK